MSTLRSLLVRSVLLAQEGDEPDILQTVVKCAESVAQCRAVGILADGGWQNVGAGGRGLRPAEVRAAGAGVLGGRVALTSPEWAWAYPIPAAHGRPGFLVVSADAEPAESSQVLLQSVAQLAGLALASIQLRAGDRADAAALRADNLALRRSMQIYDRLAQVTMRGEGQNGIAKAVYELTGHPAAIEDAFGNLIAWAGEDRPHQYRDGRDGEREPRLDRSTAAPGPVRDGDRLISVARIAGAAVGAIVLADPVLTAGEAERVVLEHATTALAMEVARVQSLEESLARVRSNLVLKLVSDEDTAAALSQAQALGYDLGRAHRVVAIKCPANPAVDSEIFLHAVRRAADAAGAATLIAARLTEVIMLAQADVAWELFHASVEAEARGPGCSIGVGGRCLQAGDFPRSHREAQLALRIQQAVGSTGKVTVFDDLGVYQVLATEADTSAMEAFVRDWLGALLSYDAVHGAQLVRTLTEFLDCGGSYAAATAALAVHRSTLKYRLRRIREVSGHDLGVPDTHFNLQVATRAWRTLQALRGPEQVLS